MTFEFADAEPSAAELPYEPRLGFTREAWRKLILYTTRCELEIGGLGLLEEDGQDFVLADVLIVEQDVNDIATRLQPAAVHDLMIALIGSDRDPSGLKVWWHSHAREGVFWSGEDEETIERFRNDFMLSIVTSHRLQVVGRIDYYEPRSTRWVRIERPEGDVVPTAEERAQIDREIAAKTRHIPRSRSRIF